MRMAGRVKIDKNFKKCNYLGNIVSLELSYRNYTSKCLNTYELLPLSGLKHIDAFSK